MPPSPSITTIASCYSQLLSYAIDLRYNRQYSETIPIAEYCFVGTSCVVLGGTTLPDHSVYVALSLLIKAHIDTWCLYVDQPAQHVRVTDLAAAYFSRSHGFVV